MKKYIERAQQLLDQTNWEDREVFVRTPMTLLAPIQLIIESLLPLVQDKAAISVFAALDGAAASALRDMANNIGISCLEMEERCGIPHTDSAPDGPIEQPWYSVVLGLTAAARTANKLDYITVVRVPPEMISQYIQEVLVFVIYSEPLFAQLGLSIDEAERLERTWAAAFTRLAPQLPVQTAA